MLLILFILVAILLAVVNGILVYSIVKPSQRFWPPPAQRTWQYYVMWLLTIFLFGGVTVVGLLDWNSLGWPAQLRWPVGGGLVVAGNILAWTGVGQLSLKTTSGHAGQFVTDGLYTFSRNPQYIGDIAIIAGWAALSASLWAIPLCLGGIAAFLIIPFAEEPWLEELHGDAYREYRLRVPRFFGTRSLTHRNVK